jgi:hypothetical protein
MPIQRQSETYGAFDDGDLRFAKEYTHRDLPEGLINMLGRGPSIMAGLNNPRQAGPDLPSYNMVSGRPGDDRHSEAEEAYYRQQEQGPMVPPDQHHIHDPGFSESPRLPGGNDPGFGVGGYDDFDPHSVENLPPDYGEQFDPHMASFMEARATKGGPASSETKTALAVSPQVVPGWIGHGYAAGHRVGLPLPQGTFKGTVTHLDGQEVGIRWDDGQHSTEEPKDLRPL